MFNVSAWNMGTRGVVRWCSTPATRHKGEGTSVEIDSVHRIGVEEDRTSVSRTDVEDCDPLIAALREQQEINRRAGWERMPDAVSLLREMRDGDGGRGSR